MIRTLTIIICIAFCACSGKKSSKEESIEDNGMRFGKLSPNESLSDIYSRQLISAFDNLNLTPYSSSSEGSDLKYRLTVVPSLLNFSYSIEVTDTDNIAFTVYDRDNKQITSSSYQPKGLDSLNFFVKKAGLWSIDNEVNTCDGGDGTLYFVEGVAGGKSTGIVRWSPKLCKVESSDEFVELINFMKQKIRPLELSELTDSR